MLNRAKFVEQITVIDPVSKGNVNLSVYRHENGGMFAIDSSYVDQVLGDDFDRVIIPDLFEEDFMLELEEN